jgi:hypothetical protein
MDAEIGDQEVQFRLDGTKGVECMCSGAMQWEACWLRIILAYIRERKPQQGAQMSHTEYTFRPLPEPPFFLLHALSASSS